MAIPSQSKFNIYENLTKDQIRVGYISTDRGYIEGLTICEANDYAKKDPGTAFILQTRDNVRYLNIETRLGYLTQQKKMLDFVEKNLK